jgi:hypothetical protein
MSTAMVTVYISTQVYWSWCVGTNRLLLVFCWLVSFKGHYGSAQHSFDHVRGLNQIRTVLIPTFLMIDCLERSWQILLCLVWHFKFQLLYRGTVVLESRYLVLVQCSRLRSNAIGLTVRRESNCWHDEKCYPVVWTNVIGNVLWNFSYA